MGNGPPEDLSREIERLWTRLGTVSTEAATPAPSPSVAGAALAWEMAAMLQTQQRGREAALAAAIDAKEEALKHWRARAEMLQSAADELRARVAASDERVFAQLLETQQRLEGAFRALEHERGERRLMEKALIDMKDAQLLAERREQEAVQAATALKGSLAEAKNALEKTLAELLLERRERVRGEEEHARALKKTEEVERRCADLQKLWEKEPLRLADGLAVSRPETTVRAGRSRVAALALAGGAVIAAALLRLRLRLRRRPPFAIF